ncbi:unnamed protein product, partial [Lymnaea stagnalis]
MSLIYLIFLTLLYENSSCQKILLHPFNQSECVTDCKDGLISDFDTVVFTSEIETSEISSVTEVHFQKKTSQDEKYTLLCDISSEKDCKDNYITNICNDKVYSTCCYCITSKNGLFSIQIRIKASVRLSRALIRGYIIRSSDHTAIVSATQMFPRIYDTTNITSSLTINSKVIDPKMDLVYIIRAKDLIVSYECKGLATPCMIEISADDSIYPVQGKEHAVFFRTYDQSKSITVNIKHAVCRLDINPTSNNIIIHLDVDSSATEDDRVEHKNLNIIIITVGASSAVLLILPCCVLIIYRSRKRHRNYILEQKLLTSELPLLNIKDLGEEGTRRSHDFVDGQENPMINPCKNTSKKRIKTTKNVDLTALQVASQNGHKDIDELLIKHEANINEKTTEGSKALSMASKNGHKDIVELLIKNNANLNEKTTDDCMALIIASEKGHKDIVELLIKNNANPNEKTTDDCMALIIASEKGHKDIVELLIKNNAN